MHFRPDLGNTAPKRTESQRVRRGTKRAKKVLKDEGLRATITTEAGWRKFRSSSVSGPSRSASTRVAIAQKGARCLVPLHAAFKGHGTFVYNAQGTLERFKDASGAGPGW